MKIAVIGAGGRSGKVFVEAALKAGHSVRAGVHTSKQFVDHPSLEVIVCDATNLHDLERLFTAQDAVVSLLGHVKGSPANVQTVAMQQTLIAMKKSGIQRLVALTGTGVRFPGDHITLLDRFLNFGVIMVDPKRIRDGKAFVNVMEASNIAWTLVRVLKLTGGGKTSFHLTKSGPAKTFVGRDEVARAILEVLERRSFIHRAPIVSKL